MNCKTHCLHCDQEFLSESAIFLFSTFQNVFLPFIFFLAYYISLMYTLFTSAYIFCFLGVCKTHLSSLQFSTTRVHLWNAIYDLRGKVLWRSLSFNLENVQTFSYPVSCLSFVFVDGMFKIFSERVSFCTGEKHFFLMFEFSIFNLASGGGGGGTGNFVLGGVSKVFTEGLLISMYKMKKVCPLLK